MSAYALPGHFPPIPTMPSSSSESCETENDTKKNIHESPPSNTATTVQNKRMPLHHCNSYRIIHQADCALRTSSSGLGLGSRRVSDSTTILVRDAKIDTVGWIHYITGGHGKPSASRKRGRMHHGAPLEDAIELELSVSRNGRTYAAKRTLHSLIELRDALHRELRRTAASAAINKKQRRHPTLDKFLSSVPQLPDLLLSSIAGNGAGYAMLQARVQSCVPAMQQWFETVLEMVPSDSDIVSNFLWEPSEASPSFGFTSLLERSSNICRPQKTHSYHRKAGSKKPAPDQISGALATILEMDSGASCEFLKQ